MTSCVLVHELDTQFFILVPPGGTNATNVFLKVPHP